MSKTQRKTSTGAGTHVRCGFCPGATAALAKVSRGVCPSCASRIATVNDALLTGGIRCPECQGRLVVDLEARRSMEPCPAVFCTECEFCTEMKFFYGE